MIAMDHDNFWRLFSLFKGETKNRPPTWCRLLIAATKGRSTPRRRRCPQDWVPPCRQASPACESVRFAGRGPAFGQTENRWDVRLGPKVSEVRCPGSAPLFFRAALNKNTWEILGGSWMVPAGKTKLISKQKKKKNALMHALRSRATFLLAWPGRSPKCLTDHGRRRWAETV